MRYKHPGHPKHTAHLEVQAPHTAHLEVLGGDLQLGVDDRAPDGFQVGQHRGHGAASLVMQVQTTSLHGPAQLVAVLGVDEQCLQQG